MPSLEEEFHRAMIEIHNLAKDFGHYGNYFIQMIGQYRGVEAAKRLLAKAEVQEGLMRLWELKQLHLTAEALVIQERFQSLFTEDEIAEARRRLEELRYFNNPDYKS